MSNNNSSVFHMMKSLKARIVLLQTIWTNEQMNWKWSQQSEQYCIEIFNLNAAMEIKVKLT